VELNGCRSQIPIEYNLKHRLAYVSGVGLGAGLLVACASRRFLERKSVALSRAYTYSG
jgi:hypothetical protein